MESSNVFSSIACFTISANFNRSTLSEKAIPKWIKQIKLKINVRSEQNQVETGICRELIIIILHRPICPCFYTRPNSKQRHNSKQIYFLNKDISKNKNWEMGALTIPTQSLQSITEKFAIPVKTPCFMHHLIQLLILILSCQNDSTNECIILMYILGEHNNPSIKRPREIIKIVCYCKWCHQSV